MTQKNKQRQTKMKNPGKNRRNFARLMLYLTILVGLFFVCRFVYLSFGGSVDSQNLAAYRDRQYAKQTVLPAKRGTIYDRTGGVIAEDANTYKIYAILSTNYKDGDKKLYVDDKPKTARVLAKYLPLSEESILATLQKKNVFQVEFGVAGSGLSLSLKNEIEAEKLTGIGFTEEPSRLYPNGVFASHLIGLAQVKEKDKVKELSGVMGIEQSYNQLLAGTDGYKSAQYDNYGYQLPAAASKMQAAKDGGSVKTTIDPGIQSYLETLLNQLQATYDLQGVRVAVMDAKTGEILGASTRPTFDPSTGEGLSKMWRNSLVEDAYEPGSVMKIWTLAAAIDAGTYNPNEYYPSGHIMVDGQKISDFDVNGWGTIPMSQAFPRSSNTGFVRIGQELGKTKFEKYLSDFGFGKKTGIQLLNENVGSYSLSNDVQAANVAFGQGISVSTMQMLQAITAITNDGEMVQPRLVTETTDQNGKVTKYDRHVVGHPIKKETAEEVRQNMRKVMTEKYGTGQTYQIKGIDAGGKTGTAQVPDPKGGYLVGENNALYSLLAVAPLNKPKYVVYISVYHSNKQQTGQMKMISDVYKPLMTRLMTLNGETESSQAASDQTVTVPAVTNSPLETAKKELTDYRVSVVGVGPRVVQQLPSAGSKVLKGSRVLLLTNGVMTMPDVSGWSKSDVLKLAQLTGKKFKIIGNGFANEQSLKPGSLLGDATVTVSFK